MLIYWNSSLKYVKLSEILLLIREVVYSIFGSETSEIFLSTSKYILEC